MTLVNLHLWHLPSKWFWKSFCTSMWCNEKSFKYSLLKLWICKYRFTFQKTKVGSGQSSKCSYVNFFYIFNWFPHLQIFWKKLGKWFGICVLPSTNQLELDVPRSSTRFFVRFLLSMKLLPNWVILPKGSFVFYLVFKESKLYVRTSQDCSWQIFHAASNFEKYETVANKVNLNCTKVTCIALQKTRQNVYVLC